MKKCLVLAAASSLLLTTFAAGPASAEEPACQQVLLVGARGSGQSIDGDREHRALHGILQKNLAGLRYDEVQVGDWNRDNILDEGGYPANGSGQWAGIGTLNLYIDWFPVMKVKWDLDRAAMGPYYVSKDAGTSNLQTWLPARANRCRQERYVLDGYSQGAHVIGDALASMPANVKARIEFVAHFGDPLAQPGVWNRGSAAVPGGSLGIFGTRVPYVPVELPRRTGLWCDVHDAVCNTAEALARALDDVAKELGSAVLDLRKVNWDPVKQAATAAHSQYADDNAEVAAAANEISERLRLRFPAWAPGLTTTLLPISVGTKAVDVAFVIDTTGSMRDDLDAAVESATDISQAVLALPDARVKLVEYRDQSDYFRARTVRGFTSSATDFTSGLAALRASGGGDTPESVFSGLMEAFTGDWRPGALKLAIVIGDAPAHDPEPGTGYRLATVLAKAKALDPVVINPVAVDGEPTAVASFQKLATGTGGKLYTSEDAADLAPAVTEAVDGFRRLPIASLQGPYPTEPNEVLTFPTGVSGVYSAARSLDPDSAISTYRWDFNGDGRAEITGFDPTVEYTFTAAYSGLVSVTVRSLDGDTNTAVLPVDIGPDKQAKTVPSAPQAMALARIPNGVRVTWEPPASDGGSPVTGYLVMAADGRPLSLVPSTATRAVEFEWPAEVAAELVLVPLNKFGTGQEARAAVPAVVPKRPLSLVVKARKKSAKLKARGSYRIVAAYTTSEPATVTASLITTPQGIRKRKAPKIMQKGTKIFVKTRKAKALKRVRLVLSATPQSPDVLSTTWQRSWKVKKVKNVKKRKKAQRRR